jgi:uncharacterized protein (TIGR03067 family)
MSRLTLALLCVLFTTSTTGQDAKTVLAKLKGTWLIEDISSDLIKVPPERLKSAKVVFVGNKMTISGLQGSQTMTFSLTPNGKPAHIDFVMPNMPSGAPGIYDLDGDNLKICFPGRDGKRPTTFDATGGRGVFVLKRKK